MSQLPNSPDLGNQSQSGDSVFENVWVFGKLNYTFENDDLGIRSIDVREPSIFRKTVTSEHEICDSDILTHEISAPSLLLAPRFGSQESIFVSRIVG